MVKWTKTVLSMGKMNLNEAFLLENKKTIYRAFERTGISLKTDGSDDSEKMKFQGQDVGVQRPHSHIENTNPCAVVYDKQKKSRILSHPNSLSLFDNAVI